MPLKLSRLIFPLGVLLLTPWPVAFAQSQAAAGLTPVQIQAVAPSSAPTWQVFGGAIGGVDMPGDLFYIDVTGSAGDMVATLYLTNTRELCHGYRYLVLKIGLYAWSSDGRWQRAVSGDGGLIPDTYLTLRNGQVSFLLSGYGKYKVTIDGGSFYATYARGSVSPQFYLTVNQA